MKFSEMLTEYLDLREQGRDDIHAPDHRKDRRLNRKSELLQSMDELIAASGVADPEQRSNEK